MHRGYPACGLIVVHHAPFAAPPRAPEAALIRTHLPMSGCRRVAQLFVVGNFSRSSIVICVCVPPTVVHPSRLRSSMVALMRSAVIGISIVLWVGLLSACTPSPPDAKGPRRQSSATDAIPTQTAPIPELSFVGTELVQDLWRPVAELPRLRTVLPIRLDPDAIETAPSLSDAPIPVAVLVVGTDPSAYRMSGVAVLSPDGKWRSIDRRRLGLQTPDLVEQQYDLSPDGSMLALGDQHGIVLVDLATATSVRVPVRPADVVLHGWTPDGSVLIFTSRGSPDRTLALNVRAREVSRLEYRAWVSSIGPDGQVVEFVQPASQPKPEFSGLRLWPTDGEPILIDLQCRLTVDPRVARRHDSLLAVMQEPSATEARRGAIRGVLALDPTTGQPVGILRLAPRQSAWTSLPGVTREGWILLNVGHGQGGGLVAWDPQGKRLLAVTAFDDQATHVRVASNVLQQN